MINKITIKNYKSFKDENTIELKPVTILIGKNSTGKSAIAKLPVLIDNSLNNVVGEPYTMEYQDVQFGGEYRDIFYGRIPNAELEFKLFTENGNCLELKIVSDFEKNTIPKIISYKLNDEFFLVFNPSTGKYDDLKTGNTYICSFDGFNIETVKGDDGIPQPPFYIGDILLRTDYIGPFRVYANNMRTFKLRTLKRIRNVGQDGEDAYHILGVESLASGSELISQVSSWYAQNFDGWKIKVNNDLQPYCMIEMYRDDQGLKINIADVGQGMSQALPLVVSAFLQNDNLLTIIEQPELHLHPAAHGSLAELFLTAAKEYNKKYLIETHSQNFVLRIRRLIAEGKFSCSDVNIYWVDYDPDNNVSSLKQINIDEFGAVDYWPENIFSESLDETLAIRTAQLNRQNDN